MSGLMKYEAACYAIQIAWQVDEVKDIRDKALAMQAYARQAKNTKMIEQATEIRLRAERRVGELLNETERNKGAATPKSNGVVTDDTVAPTLAEVGLSRQQSSDFQALAAVSREEFEKELRTGKATTRSLLGKSPKRANKPKKEAKGPKPKPEKPADTVTMAEYEELAEELEALKDHCQDLKDELKTSVALMETEPAIEMQKLRVELKDCKRRRDELMANAVEMRKELGRWQARAKKAGWKPGNEKK